jgi:hypothetical protein
VRHSGNTGPKQAMRAAKTVAVAQTLWKYPPAIGAEPAPLSTELPMNRSMRILAPISG